MFFASVVESGDDLCELRSNTLRTAPDAMNTDRVDTVTGIALVDETRTIETKRAPLSGRGSRWRLSDRIVTAPAARDESHWA